MPSKINLESILVSIDNFFNRYPFFVATVVFIWLVVIPLTEEYFQKYKFISAINAFKKLQEDPNSQLLDIRDSKSVAYLGSPNLKILNKSVVQVEFREGDEDGFLKRILETFREPTNTTVCIIDNFDGNSMKVAELLVKNGFKEAYAIREGLGAKRDGSEVSISLVTAFTFYFSGFRVIENAELYLGAVILIKLKIFREVEISTFEKHCELYPTRYPHCLYEYRSALENIVSEIQETLLPPSVHIYPKKRTKMPKQLDTNGGIKRQDGNNDDLSSNAGSSSNNTHKEIKNDDFGSISPTVQSKGGQRPLSPYPNYPDFKPPSSPTPSKPN
ncbi:UNVERIFIED_CONTAM: Rhodanese-like domain-containing protein 4A, chloroplastic [Sesamum calycinum]|uniref:Rhodanese-like domain-containing protein 4A, chloroplastic n=1 Tax=Sesamum calycinum TaxID=2727403 RepID=A0AAW2SA59_9LAMI